MTDQNEEPITMQESPHYYNVEIGGEKADPYRIAHEYGIVEMAQGHALKYLLRAGTKEGETWEQAIRKAIHALKRAIEVRR